MKLGSTAFLKFVLVLIATAVLAVFVFWLPGAAGRYAAAHPALAGLRVPALVYLYLSSIPFFAALYQAFTLLRSIDSNRAFSEHSVRALRNIQWCAVAIIGCVALGLLYVAFFLPDSRALFAGLGLFIGFVASVVATFAAVLRMLLQNAFDIQSENELTV